MPRSSVPPPLNLEPELEEALAQRAARHGRTALDEAVEILRDKLLRKGHRAHEEPDDNSDAFKQLLMQMPNVGRDEDFR